jgi:hypothetical protein
LFEVLKVLIIAPLRVARDTWSKECEKWEHLKDLRISKILGIEKERRPAVITASAGHGLNLQEGGSTAIWFGLNWSLELYQQANARLWRQGEKDTVVIHHIITKGTVDEDVMKALERKDVGQAALIEAVKVRAGEVR